MRVYWCRTMAVSFVRCRFAWCLPQVVRVTHKIGSEVTNKSHVYTKLSIRRHLTDYVTLIWMYSVFHGFNTLLFDTHAKQFLEVEKNLGRFSWNSTDGNYLVSSRLLAFIVASFNFTNSLCKWLTFDFSYLIQTYLSNPFNWAIHFATFHRQQWGKRVDLVGQRYCICMRWSSFCINLNYLMNVLQYQLQIVVHQQVRSKSTEQIWKYGNDFNCVKTIFF